MSNLSSVYGLVLVGALGVFGAGCSDDPTPATDSGSSVDVAADVAADVTRDAGSTDVPATDVPAADVPAADVPATDVPATDVPAADVPATDVPATDGGDVLAQRCTSTGGTIGTSTCCLSSGDFPSSCSVGACGCAPASSHSVQVCTCPTGRCFNPTLGCGSP